MKRLPFYCDCVGWPREDVPALCEMIETARSITRRTFLQHVNREHQADLEARLGYAPHDRDSFLTMCRDYHVSYHRSTLHGETVYYFTHSAIEYVFTRADSHGVGVGVFLHFQHHSIGQEGDCFVPQARQTLITLAGRVRLAILGPFLFA